MAYLHEDIMRKRAEKYISALNKAGINSRIIMVRDYLIKLSIEKDQKNYGNVIIDYKAKKNTFSLRMQELKERSIENILVTLWDSQGCYARDSFGDKMHATNHKTHDNFNKSNKLSKYEIYVDGSFLNNTVGFGVVILKDGHLEKEIKGLVTDHVFTESRQVGGEITAVMEALTWCKNQGIKDVSIFYDLANLEKWITGEYSTNTPMTIKYKEFVKNCGIDIKWNKVPAHSGVIWNERADELAKEGTSKCEMTCSENYQQENKSELQKEFQKEFQKECKTECSDLLEELEQVSEEFALYLEDYGYVAEFLRIYNNMAAKICIEKDGETLGYINIYNTAKLYLQPRYHEIKDPVVKEDVEKLWNDFPGKTLSKFKNIIKI